MPLLEVRNLSKNFPIRKGFFLREVGNVRAVDNVSFTIEKGKTLGLVGESGCGKSTLGRTISQIYQPTAGQILFNNQDITKINSSEIKDYRKKIQMIFQDPYASLNPRMTVSRIISEPLRIHNYGTEAEINSRVLELMDIVGLKKSHMNRYPHEFSGGQRQRIGIARALALRPELIIADEPVSALDVSIQAQILNLLKDLQKEFGLTYLFISHNLAVVEHMCDEVAVMYLGKIVEKAKCEDLFRKALHPYTQSLLNSIPKIGEGRQKIQMVLKGDVPSPINPPSGCHFHPRCVFATAECQANSPSLLSLENRQVSCFLYKKFEKNEGVTDENQPTEISTTDKKDSSGSNSNQLSGITTATGTSSDPETHQ